METVLTKITALAIVVCFHIPDKQPSLLIVDQWPVKNSGHTGISSRYFAQDLAETGTQLEWKWILDVGLSGGQKHNIVFIFAKTSAASL